jgi:predicted ATPase/class 3 adenylate cyclase/DNA-binding CsgD family transcriptional regulator
MLATMKPLDPVGGAPAVNGSDLGVGELLPTGTVTLLLADVEGSTRLWEHRSKEMAAAVARLDAVLGQIVTAHEGVRPVEQGEGDSFVIAFARASDALACAVELQRAPLAPILLRIGLHTGEVQLRDVGNYIGPTINRTARIRDLAHGGQTVVSGTTGDLVADRLPDGAWLSDLGTHRLRDLPRPERVMQVCHPDLNNEFPPLRTAKSAGAPSLPAQLTSFVGRNTEMAEIPRLLGQRRLVTLTGCGGVGKTRLAGQLAASMSPEFGDGAWFVDLAPVTDAEAVPVAVARVLGLPDQRTRSTADTVLEHLSTKHAMVVLDNCEHLLDVCAELTTAILDGCPEITVLATSREPIGVAGEAIWRVSSLSLNDSAVQLFVDRAQQVCPDFNLADGEAVTLAEICRRLDGIPLAIELAAARVRVLSLTDIASSLNDRFRLLTGGVRTAVRRQQTLRASVDWSYALLSEPERVLLHRLAVFMGGFDLPAAQAVTGGEEVASHQVLDMLTLLVDKSLVVAETASGRTRYRLLETVRQYAQEKLGESGEAEMLHARHAEHYTTVAARLDNPGQSRLDTLVAETDLEFDNLQAAFTWCRDSANPEHALKLASALTPRWLMRGRLTQASTWFDAILGDENRQRTDITRATYARALADHAFLRGWYGIPAVEQAEQAVAIARELDDLPLLVRALNGRSGCFDPAAAAPHIEEALKLVRALGDNWRLSQTLIWSGYIALGSGDPIRVRADADEGLRLAEAAGDGFTARLCRTWRALSHLFQGDLTAAAAESRTVMADARAAHDGIAQVLGSITMGLTLAYQGDGVGARTATEEGLKVSAALGDFDADVANSVLAHTAIAVGDVATAVSACEEACRIGMAARELIILGLTPLAPTALADGDVVAARRWADETVSKTAGWQQMVAHVERARVAIALGELDLAERDAHDALSIGTEIQSVFAAADALECLAELAITGDSHRQAARLYGAAHAIRQRHGIARLEIYQPGHDSAITEVRNTLEDKEFDEAWTQGAALTTDEAINYARRGRGERKRPPTGWASLTPTEHEVVKLVNEGLTNKDIATRLFVSPRTVHTHLTHIYARLGLSSRVQLVQEAARHS